MRVSTCAVYVALVLLACTDLLAAAESAPGAATYAYKGHQVSAAWLNEQYAYFKDKIAHVDGKFYDIDKAVLASSEGAVNVLNKPATDATVRNAAKGRRPGVGVGVKEILIAAVTREPPCVGEARVPCNIALWRGRDAQATVLQIVGKDQAIITRPAKAPMVGVPGQDEVLFHVRGIDPMKHIDGTFFNELLVYAGTYQYINTVGAKRTIQSFVVYQPITLEQFVAALAGGLELVRYKTVTKKVPEMRGGSVGNGFSGVQSATKVMVDKKEVVGQPVAPPAGAPLVRSTPPGAETPGSGDE